MTLFSVFIITVRDTHESWVELNRVNQASVFCEHCKRSGLPLPRGLQGVEEQGEATLDMETAPGRTHSAAACAGSPQTPTCSNTHRHCPTARSPSLTCFPHSPGLPPETQMFRTMTCEQKWQGHFSDAQVMCLLFSSSWDFHCPGLQSSRWSGLPDPHQALWEINLCVLIAWDTRVRCRS